MGSDVEWQSQCVCKILARSVFTASEVGSLTRADLGADALSQAATRACLLGCGQYGLRFIEALLLRRFVPQPCRSQETGAITLRQLIGLTNKFLDSEDRKSTRLNSSH